MPDDALTQQLDRIVDAIRDVLADDALGAYLYGSALAGGLRPGSDIDVFAVSRRRTTSADRQRLVDLLRPISSRRSRPASWRPVELTIVVQAEVRPWRYPPRIDFQYGEWLRDEFDTGNLQPWPPSNPDLAVLISMVLLAARPLFGPPPADLLDVVPRGDLVRAMVDEVGSLLDDLDTDTGNVILTLARIWRTLAMGDIASKDGAADWVLERLPAEHRGPLARALDVYLGREEDRWDDLGSAVRAHAAHVVAEIQRLASEPTP